MEAVSWQAVSRRSLTAEAPFQSQVRSREIRGEKLVLGQVLLQALRFSPLIISPPMLRAHLHLYVLLNRRTNGRSLGSFQTTVLFQKSRNNGYKNNITYYLKG